MSPPVNAFVADEPVAAVDLPTTIKTTSTTNKSLKQSVDQRKTASTTSPIRISSFNQNLLKYSLSNLAERINDQTAISCHMSTLSLDEQYLIDEIQATATRRLMVVSNSAGSTGFLARNSIVQQDTVQEVKSSDEVDSSPISGSSPKSTHSLSYSISPSPSSNLSSNQHSSIETSTSGDKESIHGATEIFGNPNILLADSISDDEDDEELFGSSRLDEDNRRETLIFKQDDKELDSLSMRNHDDEDDIDLNITPSDVSNSLVSNSTAASISAVKKEKRSSSSRRVISKPSDTLSSNNSSSLACEVASLTSVYSNYSQYDFLQQNMASSPPPSRLPVSSKTAPAVDASSTMPSHSTSFSSFLGIFSKKPPQQPKSIEKSSTTTLTSSATSSTKTLDLIASKFFNIKPSTNTSNLVPKSLTESIVTSSARPAATAGSSAEICQSKTQTILSKQASMYSTPSSSSTSLSDQSNKQTHTADPPSATIKPNFSSNNLIGDPDLQVPSSVLIFENRPSNLPAKSQQEELKHRQEYEKMIEAAKKKEQKEKELKIKKYQQQIRKEDFMAQSLRLWNTEILTNWNEQKNTRRTQQLWWHGIPPSVRGKVWKLAIGNELNLTEESYMFHWKKAKQKLKYLNRESKANDANASTNDSSVELIQLDVSRTFPHLCFFQKDGPYHEALHNVLGAYACYNTSMGYVQGMSFLTAILLLNMDPPDAFICLANLLNTKYLLACFCMDQTKMNRFFRVHQILLEYNLPKVYRHFTEQKVKPDLYLIEWIFTLFSKSLPLDVMSRVWDVFFRDKEEFLFKTALGILKMYKDRLLEMDFIHIVQFLTKLPEDINATQLFKSIDSIHTNIDDTYLTFDNLINEIVVGASSSHHPASSSSSSYHS